MQWCLSISVFIILSLTQPLYGYPENPPPKTTLSGKIIDKSTGLPVPGAAIYIPDLKTGTVSDDNGMYKIENLPAIKLLVQVSQPGYKLIAMVIDLSITTNMDFIMDESIAELSEIIITGLSGAAENNKTPTPISTIPHNMLLETATTNIIDAISKEPGLSQITTGTGISKP